VGAFVRALRRRRRSKGRPARTAESSVQHAPGIRAPLGLTEGVQISEEVERTTQLIGELRRGKLFHKGFQVGFFPCETAHHTVGNTANAPRSFSAYIYIQHTAKDSMMFDPQGTPPRGGKRFETKQKSVVGGI
jgi:hypothetical protein